MNFRKLGKHYTTSFTKLRKSLAQKIYRPDLQAFAACNPKIFNVIQEESHKRTTPSGYLRKVQARDLFEFLYPDVYNVCKMCGGQTKWQGQLGTYAAYCSRPCRDRSPDVVRKRAETSFKRFGCEPNLHPQIRKKKIAAFRKNYGVDHPSQSEALQKQMKDKERALHGVDHWTQRPGAKSTFAISNPMRDAGSVKRMKTTNVSRYGVENVFSNKKMQARIRATCVRRYGVENPGTFVGKYKKVIDAFGVEHLVCGAEGVVIDYLGKLAGVKKITTDTRKLPTIRTSCGTYYPDMMIHTMSGHHLVEAKSDFTFLNGLESLVHKSKAATRYMRRRGGTFWVLVVGKKGKMHRVKNPSSVQDFSGLLTKLSPQLATLFRT